MKLAVVTPVFNDWESFSSLLADLRVPGAEITEIAVVAVDDGSSTPPHVDHSLAKSLDHLSSVDIVRLPCNLGHQRAIAVGLSYVADKMKCDSVIVMDADGEDVPSDIPRLIKEAAKHPDKIVVAQRNKRRETALFRLFYVFYKILFRMLTGRAISFGNYSLIPYNLVSRLVSLSSLWNNMPATIIRSRIPMTLLDTDRGTRYHGSSKMNLVALVLHGLSSIAVFVDVVAVRILLGCFLLVSASMVGFGAIWMSQVSFGADLPGWLGIMALSLAVIFTQTLVTSIFVIFLVLNSKTGPTVIPRIHYVDFLYEINRVHPSDDSRNDASSADASQAESSK